MDIEDLYNIYTHIKSYLIFLKNIFRYVSHIFQSAVLLLSLYFT